MMSKRSVPPGENTKFTFGWGNWSWYLGNGEEKENHDVTLEEARKHLQMFPHFFGDGVKLLKRERCIALHNYHHNLGAGLIRDVHAYVRELVSEFSGFSLEELKKDFVCYEQLEKKLIDRCPTMAVEALIKIEGVPKYFDWRGITRIDLEFFHPKFIHLLSQMILDEEFQFSCFASEETKEKWKNKSEGFQKGYMKDEDRLEIPQIVSSVLLYDAIIIPENLKFDFNINDNSKIEDFFLENLDNTKQTPEGANSVLDNPENNTKQSPEGANIVLDNLDNSTKQSPVGAKIVLDNSDNSQIEKFFHENLDNTKPIFENPEFTVWLRGVVSKILESKPATQLVAIIGMLVVFNLLIQKKSVQKETKKKETK